MKNNFVAVGWRCFSNIGLIKYFGKSDDIPINPSIGINLSNCFSDTWVYLKPLMDKNDVLEFYLNGEKNEFYFRKLGDPIRKVLKQIPKLSKYKIIIEANCQIYRTFSDLAYESITGGIALCFSDIEKQILEKNFGKYEFSFNKRASYLAGFFSEGACRSIQENFSIYGKSYFFEDSNDEFAITIKEDIHSIFLKLKSAIFITDPIDVENFDYSKNLFNNHPFKFSRISQAKYHIGLFIDALISGNIIAFNNVIEQECMSFHAMLMTCFPSLLMLKSTTITILDKIKILRTETGLPICYTLDFNSNIYLIYPEDIDNEIKIFVESDLSNALISKVIFNDLGNAPIKLEENVYNSNVQKTLLNEIL